MSERAHRHAWRPGGLPEGELEQVARRLVPMRSGWEGAAFHCYCGARLVRTPSELTNQWQRAIQLGPGMPWHRAVADQSQPDGGRGTESPAERLWPGAGGDPETRGPKWEADAYQEWEVGPATWEEEQDGRDVLTTSLYPPGFDPSKQPLPSPPPLGTTLIPKAAQVVLELDRDGEPFDLHAITIEDLAAVLAELTKTEKEGGPGGWHAKVHRPGLERALRELLQMTPERIREVTITPSDPLDPDEEERLDREAGAVMQGGWAREVWRRLRETNSTLTLYEVAHAMVRSGNQPLSAKQHAEEAQRAREARKRDAAEIREKDEKLAEVELNNLRNALAAHVFLEVVEPLAEAAEEALRQYPHLEREAIRKALDTWGSVREQINPTKQEPDADPSA